MATTYGAGPSEGRKPSSSPRPKGRAESAKNTLCRNVTIYGYCRHEKDGCMYNHDVAKPENVQAQSESSKKRLNVDSPSFTPGLPDSNGAAAAAKKTISPKAAAAASFTPRSSKAALATPPPISRTQSSEWSNHEIPEFVPQSFNPNPLIDQPPQGIADPFNPYGDSSNYPALESTPPTQSLNPYAPDTSSTTGGPYFQQPPSFAQPLQYHLYAPIGPHRENLLAHQRTAHDFFISENLRQELQRKADATLQVLPNSNLPTNIEHFHSLVPLDTNNQKNTVAFGYNSWVYKAVSSKDGYTYALRRLEGFRLTSEKAIRTVHAWKRINNGSAVTIHDCFTTRAFGDSSLVLVTDYHPLSKTLAEQHFSYSTNYNKTRPVVPEPVLWSYIVQIASALKAIHANGLAARLIMPSKTLITHKNRIRINGCAVLDVVQSNDPRTLAQLQQEDMQQLGRMILALASNTPNLASNPRAFDSISRTYSARFKDCIVSLTENPRDIDTFLGGIADQIVATLDQSLQLEDELYSDLSRELENARLVRLMTKFGFINERPDGGDQTHGQSQWAETGERYYLKLFRDYVFHQVSQDGSPVIDLGHVISCLNKLDAGSEEKIALVSRDEQNVFVVSYKEVKRSIENAFQDLIKAQRRT